MGGESASRGVCIQGGESASRAAYGGEGGRPLGHVTCDAWWEANPPPAVDGQTPVKTLSCPELRLRAVKIEYVVSPAR